MDSRRTHLLALGAGLLALLLAGSPTAAIASEDLPSAEARAEATSLNAAELQYLWKESRGWEYDTYYIFPYTRHMPDTELPFAAQIALYPFAFVLDLAEVPLGALYGLAGK